MKTDSLFYRLFQTDPSFAEEIQAMFDFNDISLKETRFHQQAFSEGEIQGQAKGRVEGEAALLLRQLERRFGPLPESARLRVATADAETLLAWGERILDAESLEDVWGH
jgi:predicted transposase YdaD